MVRNVEKTKEQALARVDPANQFSVKEGRMMMGSKYISGADFKKRLVDLCLKSGLTDFPTKRQDQLVMLKSIATSFKPATIYSEIQVNEGIKMWLSKIACFPGWDYIMLRRSLVDEGFLTRKPDGSGYWVCAGDPDGVAFEQEISGYDICEIITEGQRLIARKKAEYLLKGGTK